MQVVLAGLVVVGMFIVGRLVPRYDARIVMAIGMTLSIYSLWQMTQFSPQMDYWPVITAGLTQGLGVGAVNVCLSVLALEAEFGNHVYSADMVARGKPHPDIFLFAADRLGVRPDKCLVIEDSAGGIRAAAAAGMTSVGLCAASHIRDGHHLKLKDAGAVHLAHSWSDVEHFAQQFFKC